MLCIEMQNTLSPILICRKNLIGDTDNEKKENDIRISSIHDHRYLGDTGDQGNSRMRQ